MKQFTVISTKRRTYISFDGKIFFTNNDWANHEFTEVKEAETPVAPEKWIKDEGFKANTLQEAYQIYITWLKAFKASRAAEAAEHDARMEVAVKNIASLSITEAYEAIRWAASKGWGWRAAHLLLADSSLSKAILSKVGSYTVTPFDDNSILIKAGNKRYGVNSRKWNHLSEIIEGI